MENIKLPQSDGWISRVKENSFNNIKQYDSCAQSILCEFMKELNISDPLLMSAAGALHGGLMSSLTCGVHIAGMMILGLFIGRDEIEKGLDAIIPIINPSQELMKRLNQKLGSHSCMELTGVDFTDLNQATEFYISKEREKCFSYVADGAEEIALFLQEIEERGELFRI